MRFSQRIGALPIPKQIQLDSMDEALRASLWNEVSPRFATAVTVHWIEAAQYLARDLFKIPTDTIPGSHKEAYTWVRRHFFDGEWHQTYDILEYLAQNIDDICNSPQAS